MKRYLLIGLCVLAHVAMAATDYRSSVVGQWQCQSRVATEYGNTLAVGDVTFGDNGALEGRGNLLLSHPSITTEIPLATVVTSRWRFENNVVYLSQIDGNIVSPYPLLNGMATNLKQQALANPTFSMQLIRIGSKTMAFKTPDGTEILCLRR